MFLCIAGLVVKHQLAAAMQLALARAIRHDQIHEESVELNIWGPLPFL